MNEPISKATHSVKEAMRRLMALCEETGQRNGITITVNPSTGYMRAMSFDADKQEVTYDVYTLDGKNWYQIDRKEV